MIPESEYPLELLELVQPGNSIRVFYNPNNSNNEIRHIRAIVDEAHIVYRVKRTYKVNDLYPGCWTLRPED